VPPSRDDACPPESAAKHVAHRSVLAEHLPSGPGKTSSLRDWSRARSRYGTSSPAMGIASSCAPL
jgi:hypothetical protein